MKWFKRSCWLFAWSVWVWLGFGLYRELPRDLGKPLCVLPKSTGTGLLGFVGDTRQVALMHYYEKGPPSLDVVDAVTGEIARSVPLDQSNGFMWSQRYGFVFLGRLAQEGKSVDGLHALDLRTGIWRRLSTNWPNEFRLHPEKPWLMYIELSKGLAQQRIFVVDFSTGRTVFASEPTRLQENDCAFFIPGTDKLAVPVGLRSKGEATKYEVWKLTEPPVLERTTSLSVSGRFASASASGRVVFAERGFNPPFDVHELETGRLLFSSPRDEKAIGSMHGMLFWPSISRSGRTVFGGGISSLWDVEAGARIWSPRTYEIPWYDDSNEYFVVTEHWHLLWSNQFPGYRFQTRAFRRFEDGALLYRTKLKGPLQVGNNYCETNDLCVADDLTVYCFPPLVNWPLLALCQSILAMPLVLFWAVLRWRRKRLSARTANAAS
jgi:hypothetical protein